MQVFRRLLCVALAAAILPAPAFAQQTHVISKSALDQAVQQRVSQDEADREALRTFMQNPTVRDVVAKAGLSIDKTAAAASMLQGDDLHAAANQARTVNDELAGGDVVVISTTLIIIILLVVILIVVAAH
jgi:hypothetical protein